MGENLRENIGTPWSEDALLITESTILAKKWFYAKLISTSLEEHFQHFKHFKKIETLESYLAFEPTVFGRVVRTAFYVSEKKLHQKKFLEEIFMNFFWPWVNNFRLLKKKTSSVFLKMHSMNPEEHSGNFSKELSIFKIPLSFYGYDNMFYPNWQIPEKKNNPLKEKIFFS